MTKIPDYEASLGFTASLAFKILLPVLMVLLATCILLFAVYLERMYEQGADTLNNQLNIFATSKATELSEPLWNFQDDLLSQLMHSYRDNRDLLSAVLYDSQGNVILSEAGADIPSYTNTMKAERWLTREVRGDVIELGKLEVVFHDGHLAKELNARRKSDILFTLILVAVLGAAIWLAIHMLVGRPLHRLKVSLHENTARKSRPPLVWQSNDELGEVVAAYNAMLHEVEQQTAKLIKANRALKAVIAKRRDAETKLARAHDELENKVALRTMELRKANEDLIELDLQRSAFLSSASHELRTPLAAILGFAVLVRKQFNKHYMPHSEALGLTKRGETILSNLEIINTEGDRLTRLINDLLDLNKIEAGHMEWRDTGIDIAEELERSARTMDSSVERNPDLELILDIRSPLPAIQFDPDRFQQLLINLLSNAVKHTPSGRVAITAEAANGSCYIRVADTGNGIPAEDIKFIFHKFYQSGSSDTNKPSGTGLGLPICKNIVEHYGGTIKVESELDTGSTFTVQLPVEPLPS